MNPNAALYDLTLLMYERPGLIVAAALLIPLLLGILIDRLGSRPTGALETAAVEEEAEATAEAPTEAAAEELEPEPEHGLTYGFGRRDIDKWALKRASSKE